MALYCTVRYKYTCFPDLLSVCLPSSQQQRSARLDSIGFEILDEVFTSKMNPSQTRVVHCGPAILDITLSGVVDHSQSGIFIP